MKGFFMKRAPKEMSSEENRNYLEESNIPISAGSRKNKFGAFSETAKSVLATSGRKDYNSPGYKAPTADDVANDHRERLWGPSGNPRDRGERIFKGSGGSGSAGGAAGGAAANPYAAAPASTGGNPYANQSSSSGNPYASAGSGGGNPYASASASGGGGNPYGSSKYGDAPAGRYGDTQVGTYGDGGPAVRTPTQSTEAARSDLFRGARHAQAEQRDPERFTFETGNDDSVRRDRARPSASAADDGGDEDELLMMPSELQREKPAQPENKGGSAWKDYELDEERNSEDEETDALKQQIRFTKQQTVQSTRNTERSAAAALASGHAALGMLGAQGERIAHTENTLALAEQQNKVAEDKARELARLNRSIFRPNFSNPFGAKSRNLEKEARMRSEYMQTQIARQNRRQTAYESEQRVMAGLNDDGPAVSETAMRYKLERLRGSDSRKKYQFEADSEDEDLEDEIAMNMDEISNMAGKLNKLGRAIGAEVDSQNARLDRITDQTDNLDVDVHLNSARMATLK